MRIGQYQQRLVLLLAFAAAALLLSAHFLRSSDQKTQMGSLIEKKQQCPACPKCPPPHASCRPSDGNPTKPSPNLLFMTCPSDPNEQEDTRTWEFSPDLLPQWQRGEYPHQRKFDPACPRWVISSVVIRFGFGHKTGNWITGLIGAQVLGLRSVYLPFEASDDHKNTPKDLAKWMGFDIDEFTEADLPSNVTKLVVPAIPMAAKHHQTFKPAIEFLKEKRECNVLFQINEGITAPSNWGLAHSIISHKYRKARAAHPEDTHLFSRNAINIAIHIRVGDWIPTSPEWHTAVGLHLVTLLHDTPVGCAKTTGKDYPIQFHVFASDNAAVLEPLKKLPNVSFHFENAKVTMHHLIMSDIFIASSSGFSQAAYLAALKPLVITPPSREHNLPFADCHHASHICLSQEAEWDTFHTARVLHWRQRFLAAKAPHLLS